MAIKTPIRKSPKSPRKQWIKGYFRPADVARIKRNAAKSGLSASSYIAQIIMEHLPAAERDLEAK